MKSIYGRLYFAFFMTILVSFLLAGFFAIRRTDDNTNQIAYSELERASKHIADLIELVGPDDQKSVLSDYSQSSEMSFNIYNENIDKTYGHMNKKSRFSEAEKKAMLSVINGKKTTNTSSLVAYAKTYEIEGIRYVISVQRDNTLEKSTFVTSYIVSGLILLLVGSVVFLIISDFIVKPISNLTKATNELIKGNYRVRVNYAGEDEISKLYNAFNQMAIQLAKQEETRQQFISDVSHEFQTPLTAISGFANILKSENLPDDQRKKYASIISSNSQRLSTLSKNMLQLTLLEGEDTKLDIHEYSLIDQLNRVIETQDYTALSKDIEIEFIKPKGEIFIEADESRMEQVWINLINNAIKYTEEHGVVTVEVKRWGKDISVLIHDTGIGMSEETISHIFERFYRDDKSRAVEGNGLGLSIVSRIIALHGFKIDVTSEEDAGSVFTVKMPLSTKSYVNKLIVNRKD
jgi:signal transduction histidine kinase